VSNCVLDILPDQNHVQLLPGAPSRTTERKSTRKTVFFTLGMIHLVILVSCPRSTMWRILFVRAAITTIRKDVSLRLKRTPQTPNTRPRTHLQQQQVPETHLFREDISERWSCRQTPTLRDPYPLYTNDSVCAGILALGLCEGLIVDSKYTLLVSFPARNDNVVMVQMLWKVRASLQQRWAAAAVGVKSPRPAHMIRLVE
jgi:hypothetical protein